MDYQCRQAFRIGKALQSPSKKKKSHLVSVQCEFQKLCFPRLGSKLDCPDEARRWGWRIDFDSACFWLPASSTWDTVQVWAWQLIKPLDVVHKMNLTHTRLRNTVSEPQAFACFRLCLVRSVAQFPHTVGVKGAGPLQNKIVHDCLWFTGEKKPQTGKAQ